MQLEADTITKLFMEGLDLLHLRKPDADLFTLSALVQKIPVVYRHKIVLHPPRFKTDVPTMQQVIIKMIDWMGRYHIHRLHITEWLRTPLQYATGVMDYLSNLNTMIFSTGIHNWTSLRELWWPDENGDQPTSRQYPLNYNYVLVSPLFNSCSKPGYLANPALLRMPAAAITKAAPKLIAMGGLMPGNLRQVFQAGYAGAALLGSIWPALGQATVSGAEWQKQAIDQFKTSKEIWTHIYRS